MSDIKQRIITKIKLNRISTTEVADCMNKTGLFYGAKCVNAGKFAVGNVKWAYVYDNSNWSIHEQARDVNPGDVVMIEAFNCGDRATIGELVTKYLVLYQEAAAIISNAPLRDANDLIKNRYPVWCDGFTPIGTFNTKNEKPLDPEIEKKHKEMYDETIAVCDDSGVVIIPREFHTEEFLQKLEDMEEQEDIWFECLDRKKWDTYDIVCLKKYKDENK